MKLQPYLDLKSISPASFAAMLGTVTESGVRKWLRGERVPRPDVMRRIHEITNGEVSPSDFFISSEAPPSEAA